MVQLKDLQVKKPMVASFGIVVPQSDMIGGTYGANIVGIISLIVMLLHAYTEAFCSLYFTLAHMQRYKQEHAKSMILIQANHPKLLCHRKLQSFALSPPRGTRAPGSIFIKSLSGNGSDNSRLFFDAHSSEKNFIRLGFIEPKSAEQIHDLLENIHFPPSGTLKLHLQPKILIPEPRKGTALMVQA
ncbi:hypothetical protein CR513_53221, partial [Mucuna pruriens]